MAQIHFLDRGLDVRGPVDVLAAAAPLGGGQVCAFLPDGRGREPLFRQTLAHRVHFVHDPHQIAA